MRRPGKRGLRIEPLENRRLLVASLGLQAIDKFPEGEETLGRIAGHVYLDLNQNGLRDESESVLAQEPVFLDLNQNRLRDLDLSGVLEPSVLTDDSGLFEFNMLEMGTYVVALENVLPDETTVPRNISLGTALPQENTVGASAVAVADVNGDGLADLISTNARDNAIVFGLFPASSSVLTQAAAPSLGSEPVDMVVEDFDGDDQIDIAVATRVGRVNLLLSQSTDVLNHEGCESITDVELSLIYPTICQIPSTGALTSIQAADFDRDGDIDFVVAAEVDATQGQLEIFANDGRGGFSSSGSKLVGPRPQSLVVGEFRTDFGPEVAFLNAGTDSESGSVTIVTIDGTIPSEVDTLVGVAGLGTQDLTFTDLNRDGHQDFIVVSALTNEVTVFWYDSQREVYEPLALPQTPIQMSLATSIAVADFDLDQDVDLVFINGQQLAFIANETLGSAQQPQFATTQIIGQTPVSDPESIQIVAGDINEDSLLDIVLAWEAVDSGGVATAANLLTGHRVELSEEMPDQSVEFGVLLNPHINRQSPADVDGENGITARDALLIINQIGRVNGGGELPLQNTFGVFLDVNGDRRVTAGDALVVINRLQVTQPSSGFHVLPDDASTNNDHVLSQARLLEKEDLEFRWLESDPNLF